MSEPKIFLLGATGYVGSQFLIMLGRTLPNLSVAALVRSTNQDRLNWLRRAHPKLTVVEGTLEDSSIIEDQAANADIVLNIASCDHVPCAEGKSVRSKYHFRDFDAF